MSDRNNEDKWIVWALLLAVVAAVVLGKISYAHFMYDDWTCAFAHCVKIK